MFDTKICFIWFHWRENGTFSLWFWKLSPWIKYNDKGQQHNEGYLQISKQTSISDLLKFTLYFHNISQSLESGLIVVDVSRLNNVLPETRFI